MEGYIEFNDLGDDCLEPGALVHELVEADAQRVSANLVRCSVRENKQTNKQSSLGDKTTNGTRRTRNRNKYNEEQATEIIPRQVLTSAVELMRLLCCNCEAVSGPSLASPEQTRSTGRLVRCN